MANKYLALLFGLLLVLLGVMAILTLLLPSNVAGGLWYIQRPAPQPASFVIIDEGQERTVVRKDPDRSVAGGISPVARGDYWLRPFGIYRPGIEGFVGYLTSYITLMALSLVMIYLIPRRVATMMEIMQGDGRQHLTVLLAGMIGLLGTIMLGLLLWLNVVLTPLVVLLAPVALLGLLLGLVPVALGLGRAILRALHIGTTFDISGNVTGGGSAVLGNARAGVAAPSQALLIGMTIIYLLSLVPYLIGWILIGVAAVYGFGTLILTRLGTGEPWSLDELEA